ncbi:hypothetical protein EMQ25_11715 [Arsenicitalea aurantiaca]|uniref:PD-(D/E)XK nuclease-like domain-containing protein n=1 Tax=Arsenicitalea aurantiaca TaxID=1783274 RepID=A0A433X7D0_9HYPH|nr:hypothetical protein [Arsenicitalea aurantiaca]RUT29997.1 hypothetical protein EMQ25_11715 [Arsenicitalea aurantiaca]
MPNTNSMLASEPHGRSADPLDPTGLGPMNVVPLVPADVLGKHKALVETDTRFRSAARLLQSLWREDRDLPIGSFLTADEKRVRLGSRITEAAGRSGGNFLSPDIALLVRREVIYRELGALIEVDRLRTNLLSSMPLTFNLFAPLKFDLKQASRFAADLFPNLIKEMVAIRFEHAPRRGSAIYTGDYSAFDVALYGVSPEGRRVMIAFEIKYSESGAEPSPVRISDRQLDLTANTGIYAEPEDPALFGLGLQQLTREANLAQAMLDHGDVDEAYFVLSAPRLNHLCQEMGQAFAARLVPPEPGKVRFLSITLERLVEALANIGMIEHAQALHRRYLDFWQIDGELELHLAAEGRRPMPQKAPRRAHPEPESLEAR